MEKINFIDKGETGYEDTPINADNLNLLQNNVETSINEVQENLETLSSNVLQFEVIGTIDETSTTSTEEE